MSEKEVTAAVRAQLSMLTPDQVCELLQVSKVWLYKQVRAGTFPHVKVGRLLRFRASDVDAYLAGEWLAPEKETTPAQAAPRRRGRPRKQF